MKLKYEAPKRARIKKGTQKAQHPHNPKIHRGSYFFHVEVECPGKSIWFNEKGQWVDTNVNPNKRSMMHDIFKDQGVEVDTVCNGYNKPKSVKAFKRFVARAKFPKGSIVTFVAAFKKFNVTVKI